METAQIFRNYQEKKKKIKHLILANEKQNVSRKEDCAFEILKRGKVND